MSEDLLTQHELTVVLENAPEWRFAKTMPQDPHWYSLRKLWDDGLFNHCVQQIRDYSVSVKFKRSYYKHFRANGWTYWSMGYPVEQTTLINRAGIPYHNKYDAQSDTYDDLYRHLDDQSAAMVEMCDLKPGMRILDAGCGTGLVLDFSSISTVDPGRYIGIDNSVGMLSHAVKKHPDHEFRLCAFEHWRTRGWDRVLMLFGAANHFDRESLKRIPWMLNPGGKAIIVWADKEKTLCDVNGMPWIDYDPDLFPESTVEKFDHFLVETIHCPPWM